MLIPWALLVHIRGKNEGRHRGQLGAFIVASVISSLIIAGTPLASGRSTEDTQCGPEMILDGNMYWHFSSAEDIEVTANDVDRLDHSNPDDRFGYWLKTIPWLGFTLDNPVLTSDEEESSSSVVGGTNISPITGFLVMRYPTGQLQPYFGIGSTLSINDHGFEHLGLFEHFVMGLSYIF